MVSLTTVRGDVLARTGKPGAPCPILEGIHPS